MRPVFNQKILIIGGEGYIGSFLRDCIKAAGVKKVHSLDTCRFGSVSNDNINQDYISLNQRDISKYDTIIILAGNSSVGLCSDSDDTLKQNYIATHRIFEMASYDQTVIYASSGSLCNGRLNSTEDYYPDKYINNYDYSKYLIEYSHKKFFNRKNIYGLRFGTVFGYSRNFRNDTILNKISLAQDKGENVNIYNPDVSRGFLSIEDLAACVGRIINNPKSPGIYNISSFNATFSEVGSALRQINKDVKISYHKNDNIGYDFSMNSSKFYNEFSFLPEIKNIDDAMVSLAECAKRINNSWFEFSCGIVGGR